MSNTDDLSSFMRAEYDRLSVKSPAEIAENFRIAYSALLYANKDKPFLGWLLLQAPANILPCSLNETTFAGTDGKMHINPVFWSAIVKWHDSTRQLDIEDKRKKMMSDLGYLVLHEVGHLMLRHPWSVRRTIQDAEPEKKPGLQHIANLCVDFVVNAGFCTPLLPDAVMMQKGAVSCNKTFGEFLEKSIGPLPAKVRDMLEKPDLALWGWDDIYCVIVDNLDEKNMKKLSQNANYAGMSFGPGNAVTGTHNEKLDADTPVHRIRDGGVENGDKQAEAAWKRMAADAVVEARGMGTAAGNVARMLEGNFEARVPWETLVRDRLSSFLGYSQVQQTWLRESRRHSGFPGHVRVGGKNLWLLADVSGSMSEKDLEMIAGISLSFLRRSGGTLQVVFWDADVCGHHVVKTRADMARIKSVNGGGGTAIGPAVEHLLKNAQRNDRVCVCTDSAIADLRTDGTASGLKKVAARHGPVIWFHFGSGKVSREDLKEVTNVMGGGVIPVAVDVRSRMVDRLMPGNAGVRLV